MMSIRRRGPNLASSRFGDPNISGHKTSSGRGTTCSEVTLWVSFLGRRNLKVMV